MTALSVKSAAVELDVSEDTIRNAIDNLGLPAYRLGRAIRIERDDLIEWFRSLPKVRTEA